LPEGAGLEVTAINFSGQAIDEAVRVQGAAAGLKAIDTINPEAPATEVGSDGSLRLHLNAFEGKALRIKG
jgi:hypothetical protein